MSLSRLRFAAVGFSFLLTLTATSPLRADDTPQEAEAKEMSARVSLCLKYIYAEDTLRLKSLAPYMPLTVNRLYTLLYQETQPGDGLISEPTRMVTNVHAAGTLERGGRGAGAGANQGGEPRLCLSPCHLQV